MLVSTLFTIFFLLQSGKMSVVVLWVATIYKARVTKTKSTGSIVYCIYWYYSESSSVFRILMDPCYFKRGDHIKRVLHPLILCIRGAKERHVRWMGLDSPELLSLLLDLVLLGGQLIPMQDKTHTHIQPRCYMTPSSVIIFHHIINVIIIIITNNRVLLTDTVS